MEDLDFYCYKFDESPLQLALGDMSSRVFDGKYNEYTEFALGCGDVVIFYYGFHANDKTTFFIYPTERLSDMIKDIVKHIDIYNLPSVKKQWPYFGKAYDNYKDNSSKKVKLLSIQDAYKSNVKHFVFAITFDKYIDFNLANVFQYTEQINMLADFTCKALEEINNDNGCLNFSGFISSMLRGASPRYLIKKLLKM